MRRTLARASGDLLGRSADQQATGKSGVSPLMPANCQHKPTLVKSRRTLCNQSASPLRLNRARQLGREIERSRPDVVLRKTRGGACSSAVVSAASLEPRERSDPSRRAAAYQPGPGAGAERQSRPAAGADGLVSGRRERRGKSGIATAGGEHRCRRSSRPRARRPRLRAGCALMRVSTKEANVRCSLRRTNSGGLSWRPQLLHRESPVRAIVAQVRDAGHAAAGTKALTVMVAPPKKPTKRKKA
jgi:hypothetical protein